MWILKHTSIHVSYATALPLANQKSGLNKKKLIAK